MEASTSTPPDETVQWQEVLADRRHWERLAFENARLAFAGVAIALGAALYVWFAYSGEVMVRRSVLAALCTFAFGIVLVGYTDLLVASRQLRSLRRRSRELPPLSHFDQGSTAHWAASLGVSSELRSLQVLYLVASCFVFWSMIQTMQLESGIQAQRAAGPAARADGPASQSAVSAAPAPRPPLTVDSPVVARPSPSSAPIGSNANPIQYRATADPSYPASSLALFALAGLGIVGLLIGGLMADENRWKRATIAASLIATLSASIPLTFKGELNLKGEFHCGPGGCFPISFGGPAGAVLQSDAATPSFDIGSADVDRPTRGCFSNEPANDAAGWASWRKAFAARWRSRPNANSSDVILLVGSADASPLAGQLRVRHESNSGLALARAERVASLLRDELGGASEAPEHRLTAGRIVVTAVGPAGTGSATVAGTTDPCADSAAAEHRRVQVWLQTAPR